MCFNTALVTGYWSLLNNGERKAGVVFVPGVHIKGFHCVISVVLPTLDLLELEDMGFLGSTLRGSTVL